MEEEESEFIPVQGPSVILKGMCLGPFGTSLWEGQDEVGASEKAYSGCPLVL